MALSPGDRAPDFDLIDATGTLDFSNGAGTATAEELHRGTLVTQAVFFCKVLPTDAWLQAIAAPAGA